MFRANQTALLVISPDMQPLVDLHMQQSLADNMISCLLPVMSLIM